MYLGATHTQRGGGLFSADILRTREVLQMRTFNFVFFESYGVSTRTGGVEPVRTFLGQGEDNFSRFCADVLHGRPLITS